MVSDDGIFFVVGPPRSGMTLAGFVISQHPQAECLLENHFPIDLFQVMWPRQSDGFVESATGWTSLVRKASLGPLQGDTWGETPWTFHISNVLSVQGATRFLSEDSEMLCRSPREIAIMMVQAASRSLVDLFSMERTTAFGDKSPSYCFWWCLLREIFPRCKFIVTERNEDELASAILRLGWLQEGAGIDEAKRYIRSYSNALSGIELLDDVISVHLDDFNADPKVSIERVLDFLDLPVSSYPMADTLQRVTTGRVS